MFFVVYPFRLQDDYISTNRDGLTWAHDELQDLKSWLVDKLKIAERRWRENRTQEKECTVKEVTGINLTEWTDTMPKKYQQSINKIEKDCP